MPAVSTLTAIAAVTGAVTQGIGAVKQANAAKAVSAASRRAEDARKRQMLLEAQRKQRDIFRQGLQARAKARANIQNATGNLEGTAYQGALGQVAGEEGRQSVALAENVAIGREIFDANAAQASAQSSAAFGSAVSSFGQMLFQNSEKIGRIGSTIATGAPGGDGYGSSWTARAWDNRGNRI